MTLYWSIILTLETLAGGNGWDPKTVEISRTKWNQSGRRWAVLDISSGRGYHIIPGPNDGTADSFSNRDIWLHRYRSDEDRHGQQGDQHNDRLSDYIPICLRVIPEIPIAGSNPPIVVGINATSRDMRVAMSTL
jgi:hypothetical protein